MTSPVASTFQYVVLKGCYIISKRHTATKNAHGAQKQVFIHGWTKLGRFRRDGDTKVIGVRSILQLTVKQKW